MEQNRIQQLEELLKADPGDVDLPFLLGKALLDAGRFEEAAARLEQAVRANPALAAIRRRWGEALRGTAGEDRRGRVDDWLYPARAEE